jgi:hypothetical protein
MHISFNDILVFVLFLLSLLSLLQKPIPGYLKLFPIYFIVSFIEGLVTEYKAHHGQYNTGIANVWGIIEFCFYFFVLRQMIINIKIKKVILLILILFPLLALTILYFQKQVGFNPVNFTIGTLITVSLCIYYFVELFQKAEIESLAKLPAFWIASAILFIAVLSFPMFAFISYMKNVPRLLINNISAIYNIISVLTTLLYSIGFLCRIRTSKSTS